MDLPSIQQFQLNVPKEKRNHYAVLGIEREPLDQLLLKAEIAYIELSKIWDPLKYQAENFSLVMDIREAITLAYRKVYLEAAKENHTSFPGEEWMEFDDSEARRDLDASIQIEWVNLIFAAGERDKNRTYFSKSETYEPINILTKYPSLNSFSVERLREVYQEIVAERFKEFARSIDTFQSTHLTISILSEAEAIIAELRRRFNDYTSINTEKNNMQPSQNRNKINAKVIPQAIFELWKQLGSEHDRPQNMSSDAYWKEIDVAFGKLAFRENFASIAPYISTGDMLRMTRIAQKLRGEVMESDPRYLGSFVGMMHLHVEDHMYGTLSPMKAGNLLAASLTLHPELNADGIRKKITTLLEKFYEPNSLIQKVIHRIQPFAKTRILEAMVASLINLNEVDADYGLLEVRVVYLIEQALIVAEEVLSPADFAIFLNFVQVHLSAARAVGEKGRLLSKVEEALKPRIHLAEPPGRCRTAVYKMFFLTPGRIY